MEGKDKKMKFREKINMLKSLGIKSKNIVQDAGMSKDTVRIGKGAYKREDEKINNYCERLKTELDKIINLK